MFAKLRAAIGFTFSSHDNFSFDTSITAPFMMSDTDVSAANIA